MFGRLARSIFLLSALTFVNLLAPISQASPTYQQYQAFEDSAGNIYLKLPKQFVLIHSDIDIPLHVYPKNALVKLYQENGVWKVQILTEAQFNALTLSPSDYAVEYLDFSGDGDTEVVLRADDANQDSFILYGLENGTVSFSVHNENTDGVDLSKTSGATFVDVNGDGYKDIKYANYTLLGNAQDKFFNTARYENSQSTLVGATSGNFRVAEDGSATYQVPFNLPQGVAGVTPQAGFSYSSNGGNGAMGRGWSLSGVTSIARCPKNYIQDGYIAGVTLTKEDAYCYNGQRLILATGTHGAKDATYHTELADFSVVTITSANTNGATGFKVETKSGETYYFGTNTANSMAKAYVGDINAPSAYLIAAIQDVKDNQISYNYTQETGADEVNLDTIIWGAAQNPNELKVNYKSNPRPLYGYRNGRQFSQTQLISNVEVFQSGELVRRYDLGWDMGLVKIGNTMTDVAENISRINQIKECLIDSGTDHCLAPISFQWSSEQTGTGTRQICTEWRTGDDIFGGEPGFENYRPVCIKYEDKTYVKAFEPFAGAKGLYFADSFKNSAVNIPADANGDGLSDVFYIKDGKWALALMSSSSVGSINRAIRSSSLSEGFKDYAQPVDLDGDGRFEILYPISGAWYKLSYSASGVLSRTYIASYIGEDYKNSLLLDVDGNSFIDIVTRTSNGLYVNYNYGGTVNTFKQQLVSNSLIANNLSSSAIRLSAQTPELKNTAFLDVNGDGISDFISNASIKTYSCYIFNELGGGGIPKAHSTTAPDGSALVDDSSYAATNNYWVYQFKGTDKDDITTRCRQRASNIFDKYEVRTSEENRPLLFVGQVDSNGSANYSTAYDLDFLDGLDLKADVRIADFNGDGLSDIVYRYSAYWNIALSQGNGDFLKASIGSNILNASDINKYSYHRFMDINGDGLTDLMAYTGSSYTVYLARARANNIPTFEYRLTISVDVDDNKQLHFADFDGDSRLDMLYEQGSSMFYRLAVNPGQRQNAIEMINSGFGQTTSINYNLLQNGSLIAGESSYLSGLASTTRGATNTNYSTSFKSDFVQINRGVWVVSTASNNTYNSMTKADKTISIGYRYGGMLANKLGRGSLGFETLETTDGQTGIVTTTKYSQAYPYVAMPLSTMQVYNGKTLSSSVNTYNKKVNSKFGTFPYLEKTSELKNRLLTSGNTSFASRSELTSVYDSYGNLTSSTSKQFAAATGTTVLKQVVTANAYNGIGGGAEKGRLSSTSVTHTRDSVSKTRSSSFTYYPDGMLESATIDGLNQKTDYEYDSFGNKNSTCITDLSISEQRCSSTQWSSDGRFVLSTKNALELSESYLYNGQAGAVNGRIWSKTVTGTNKIATTQYFDIQGQVIKEQHADGTETIITRAYSSSTNKNNCVANAEKLCLYEKTSSTAKPDSYVWYDAFGRKVKAQNKGFDGNRWSSQSILYDELSRTRVTYEPYYESTSNGTMPSITKDKSIIYYDVLGRVTSTKLPNGGVDSRAYYSLENRYTDANNHTRIERFNALGELIKVESPVYKSITKYHGGDSSLLSVSEPKDSNSTQAISIVYPELEPGLIPDPAPKPDPGLIPGPDPIPGPIATTTIYKTYTDYTYNVFGKLARVDNYSNQGASHKVSIHTIYDNEGRKTGMYDPDKGHWTYSYNAFGELTSQTSANGLTTRSYYDKLGRKTKVTEQSLGNYQAAVMCYHYGNSSSAKNVGKLIKQQQFTSSNGALAGFNCASNINTIAAWQQEVSFDYLGRLASTKTTFEGKTFTQSQSYDSYSRVINQTLPEGLVVTNTYQNNYLKRIKQGALLLREIGTMDASGRVLTETIGQGISKTNVYDEVGRIESIGLANAGGQTLHNLSYTFDDVGNLTQRNQNYANDTYFSEGFVYDALNRAKVRNVTYQNIDVTQPSLPAAFAYQQRYDYDFIGNITNKRSTLNNGTLTNTDDNYTYNYQWRSHGDSTSSYPLRHYSLASIQKGSNSNYRNYSYDDNGNVTNDGSRSYQYTPFDKPWLITSGNQSSQFKYANRSRYFRLDNIQEKNSSGVNYSGLTQYKTYYSGAYERVERTGGAGNQVEHKYQIAGAILTRKEGQLSFKTLFAHTDYQGSVITVTDQAGTIAEQFIYDTWGKKTKVIISNQVASLVSDLTRSTATTRGYTGHEGIDHFDLIHMNGRVYDAEIGRFLQADPFIQYPNNSQSYNRYSYVLNNPMSYTDPSGYFSFNPFKGLKALLKGVKGVLRAIAKVPILNAAVHFVLNIIPGCQYWCSALYAAATTYAVTGSFGAAFKAGFFAAITPVGGSHFASALIGGISSVAQGGNFGHGFWSAGLGSALGGKVQTGNAFANVAISAVIGGTISKLTGGKFSNGAQTWAFSAAMAQDWSSKKAKFEWDGEYKEGSSEWEAREEAYLELEHQETLRLIDEGDLLASNWDWSGQKAQQCMSTCITSNYGDLYTTAGYLSPISLPSFAANEFGKVVSESLRGEGTRNTYADSRKLYNVGKRQVKTFAQFGRFNAAAGVIGAGALGFQVGAYGYCKVQCTFFDD